MLTLFFSKCLGSKQLNKFVIENPIFSHSKNESKLLIKFKLKRNPSYLIISAYLPSFSVMMMATVPLFLNDEIHFATTIMLVLTAQLCLYTLFQSSTTDIPKTAYLKNIDYWNMLVTTVSLSNFFTLFLWEVFQGSILFKHIKKIMKITIPILTLLGVALYLIVAGMKYYE